jgi:hypothetical protein
MRDMQLERARIDRGGGAYMEMMRLMESGWRSSSHLASPSAGAISNRIWLLEDGNSPVAIRIRDRGAVERDKRLVASFPARQES